MLLIDTINCFLAGATCALKLCNLFLGGVLPNVFQAKNNIAVLNMLSFESYLNMANYVNKHLLNSGLGFITVYTDSSVKDLGSLDACGNVATYFLNVNTSIGIKMDGLLSLTLVELQTIALALESFLPLMMSYCFLNVEDRSVIGNAYYVVKNLFNAVYSVGWETRCVGRIIGAELCGHFDKAKTFCVWHPNGKIRSDCICTVLVALWSYFIKAFYYCLPVAKRKKMYNSRYLNIACIQCGLNALLDASANKNAITSSLSETTFFIDLFTALAKSFVLKSWVVNMVDHLGADFGEGVLSYRSAIWLPAAKLRFFYKKHNLLPCDSSFFPSSVEMICNFSFRLSIYVCFGLYLHLTKLDFGFLHNISVIRNLGV
ncbi:hypothetical protein G9A89_003936 [Geosiphon pyriformis]|nr:hypothetical protein G9A89_003936 [Geosiphon pyriformis]